MSLENERLSRLIEYAQQLTRLRTNPPSHISEHNAFSFYESQLSGLPGIKVDLSEGAVWLSVQRLSQSVPPKVDSKVLSPWIDIPAYTLNVPKLRDLVPYSEVYAVSRYVQVSQLDEEPMLAKDQDLRLEEFPGADTVKLQYRQYITYVWTPWYEAEKAVRATIALYTALFNLRQLFEGAAGDAGIELVWGVGVGVWKTKGITYQYPLLTQPVDVELDALSGFIQVRPRNIEPTLEVEWFSSAENPAVASLERKSKDFFEGLANSFSPFDPATYSDLLKTAASALDANGVFWPDQTTADDRSVPSAGSSLKVTDTWLLFARPRSTNVFLKDLEKLAAAVGGDNELPPAVASLVTDPSEEASDQSYPAFRGLSSTTENENAKDLYFPKPFNDEQVRIIQLLEGASTVVVQGPPGTGKTHTIANVICHYLAHGKRVLVTSLKEPALAVLRSQLPEDIRPLAIALLSSEHEGMKQFEFAITKIAQEVQSLNKQEVGHSIAEKELIINNHHAVIASLDRKMKEWAAENLAKIVLDDVEIDPYDAAREVVEGTQYIVSIIPDDLGTNNDFRCPISFQEVSELRDARRKLGADIEYLGCTLPQIAQFPDPETIVEIHQNLSAYESLSRKINAGEVPPLADTSNEILSLAQSTLGQINELRKVRSQVDEIEKPWITDLLTEIRNDRLKSYIPIMSELGADLDEANEKHKDFVSRPVDAPPGVETDQVIIAAVEKLANGKAPFALWEHFSRTEHKKQIAEIKVNGNSVGNSEDWAHTLDFLRFRTRIKSLATRWNALSEHIPVVAVDADSRSAAMHAIKAYDVYCAAVDLVSIERKIRAAFVSLFPVWAATNSTISTSDLLDEVEGYLSHHLTKSRLSNVWINKERIQRLLDSGQGPVINSIRDFVDNKIGNPEINTLSIQSSWSALMSELARILALGPFLQTVSTLSDRLRTTGAVQLADQLCISTDQVQDNLLPDDFLTLWRNRRLLTHLQSLGSQNNFRLLSERRKTIILRLEKDYNEIIRLRTWLELAKKASPSVRASLQSYLSSIRHIGAGTGVRANRYRRDAQAAADKANPAVPCWIMPHYRVSESLPAELGCFDLVVIDEASQSDFSALPAMLRAKKALIVGDDKQVSPEAIGLEEAKVLQLINRYLTSQVPLFKAQMSPERSMYDLFKVVFANNIVVLKEHFRCVGPIIEYSKREFYNHEIKPLRLPKASERIDPPLVDVFVSNGYRDGKDINLQEIQFIVSEIKAIAANPNFANRTIGMVSLLADKQAKKLRETVESELGLDVVLRHKIECGDARTFQGKEKDIMFLSLVVAPNNLGAALTRATFEQRFNVAGSRARDRMYLVRSVELEDLRSSDVLRLGLIRHFRQPFENDQIRVADLRSLCDSDFERDLYDELTARGYTITPQVRIGQYRIDLVVEGSNDNRLAVECDGDQYHGPDKWSSDIARQRVLERAGWVFWRCFASAFIRHRTELINDLVETLSKLEIYPGSLNIAHSSIHVEHRIFQSVLGEDGNAASEIDSKSVEQDQNEEDILDILIQTNSNASTDTMPEPITNSTPGDISTSRLTVYKRNQVDSLKGDIGSFYNMSSFVQIRQVIEQVVSVEGPISKDLLAQRVAEHWNIAKVGRNVDDRISYLLTRSSVDVYASAGRTWIWQPGIKPSEYQLFRVPDTSDEFRRSPEQIPQEEIANAARHVIEKEGNIGQDNLIKSVARLFGYARTGITVSSVIEQGLKLLGN